MASYARKPQTIEAYQWNGDITEKMPKWLYDAIMDGNAIAMVGRKLFLKTEAEGDYLINDGDYIVREGDGSLSPRASWVFESEWYLLK